MTVRRSNFLNFTVGAFGFSVLTTLILSAPPASASSVRCRDIGIPKIGDVCYITTSFHLRTYNSSSKQYTLERISPNWNIVDWRIKKDWNGDGGTENGYSFLSISAQGSLTIREKLEHSNSELQKWSAALKNEVEACNLLPSGGYACDKAQADLKYANEQIRKNSQLINQTYVKGNNEAIQLTISGNGKLDFPRKRYGGMSGTFTMWQRYMGNPQPEIAATQRISLKLQDNIQAISRLKHGSESNHPTNSEDVAASDKKFKVRTRNGYKMMKRAKVIRKCKNRKKFYERNVDLCDDLT